MCVCCTSDRSVTLSLVIWLRCGGDVCGKQNIRQHDADGCFEKTWSELTLRVLWRFTGLLEAGLLALDCTSVTSEEACFFERAAVVLAIDFVQSTSNTQLDGSGLAGGAATVYQSDDVVCAF